MIEFHELDNATTVSNDQTAYEQFRFDLIRKTEGAVRSVYADHKGIPTIGIGFNLMDGYILGLVLKKFGVTDEAAQQELKDIIK